MDRDNINNLSGKTYLIDPLKLGDMSDGIKGRRPIYLLQGVNNDYFFGVLSTTKKHTGKKNTFQHKKYIMWDEKNGSYLRLDSQFGWTVMKKSDIKKDTRNLKEWIRVTNSQKEELLSFYRSVINDEKERLEEIAKINNSQGENN